MSSSRRFRTTVVATLKTSFKLGAEEQSTTNGFIDKHQKVDTGRASESSRSSSKVSRLASATSCVEGQASEKTSTVKKSSSRKLNLSKSQVTSPPKSLAGQLKGLLYLKRLRCKMRAKAAEKLELLRKEMTKVVIQYVPVR